MHSIMQLHSTLQVIIRNIFVFSCQKVYSSISISKNYFMHKYSFRKKNVYILILIHGKDKSLLCISQNSPGLESVVPCVSLPSVQGSCPAWFPCPLSDVSLWSDLLLSCLGHGSKPNDTTGEKTLFNNIPH